MAEGLVGHLPPKGDDGQVDIRLENVQDGPRKRGMIHVLRSLTAQSPEDRPQNARAVAEEWLEATALPITDKEGEQLYIRVETLAERKGVKAVERMLNEPLILALRAD